MAPKTVPTDVDPIAFIKSADPKRVDEGLKLNEILCSITNEKPVMWGPTIVGYGSYLSDEKKNVSWPLIAFSPRKAELVIYIMPGFDAYEARLKTLGPHRTGSSCLYLKNLGSVSMDCLTEIMKDSYQLMKSRYNSYS
jgi:hypothetical protein